MSVKKLRAAGACLIATLMMGTFVAVSACGIGENDAQTYTLTYKSASLAGGSVSGSPVSGSQVAAGAEVTLQASANEEYTFSGWYEGETSVSTEATYSFKMPARNYDLSAKFAEKVASYVLTFESENDAMGSVSSEVRSGAKQKTGTSITVTATANEGYDFVGWYEGETSVSANTAYSFQMPAHDYALKAKFAPTPIPTHSVSYSSSDKSQGTVVGYVNDDPFTSGTSFEEGTNIALEANAKEGYAFAGWYHGEELVSSASPYNFTLGTEDVDLVGKFIEDINALHIDFDNTMGSVLITVGGNTLDNDTVIAPNAVVTLKASPTPIERDYTINRNPQDGYVFAGWYEPEADTPKSLEADYSFRMPSSSYSLEARFIKAYTYTAQKPTDNWAYITFGNYPQTLKADNVEIITATPDALGYYTGSDGAKYYKVKATPSTESVENADGTKSEVGKKFSSAGNTDTRVVVGKDYYFKVEPLRWRVLTEQDGKAFLRADITVDCMPFQSYVKEDPAFSYVNSFNAPDETDANNYQYSEIRYWLNHDFMKLAFAGLNSGLLAKFGVDNSASFMLQMDGVSYSCNNTKDYVALMSLDEMTNSDYGFLDYTQYLEPDKNRRAPSSDYAIARGAFYFDGYDYSSGYWLRTAGVMDSYSTGYVENEQVIIVGSTGSIPGNQGVIYRRGVYEGNTMTDEIETVGPQTAGVVPSIWLEMTAINDGLSLYNPYKLDFPANDPAADFVPDAAAILKAELAGAMLPSEGKN